MAVRNLYYSLEDAISNFRSAKLLNFLCIITIAVSMFILAVFVLGMVNLDALTARWSSDARLIVYLRDDSSEEQRIALLAALQGRPGITKVDYLSKEQAMDEFRKSLKGQEAILDGLSRNPLPASFEVHLAPAYRTVDQAAFMAKDIGGQGGVEEVQYGKEWLANLSRFLVSLRYTCILLAVGLALSVTFIVANTVRLTAHARAAEVSIMRLIGATDWFIKGPFLVEGALHGLLGTALALVMTYGVYGMVTSGLMTRAMPFLHDFSLEFLPFGYCFAFLLGGTLLGLTGGLLSVGRFLKTQ